MHLARFHKSCRLLTQKVIKIPGILADSQKGGDLVRRNEHIQTTLFSEAENEIKLKIDALGQLLGKEFEEWTRMEQLQFGSHEKLWEKRQYLIREQEYLIREQEYLIREQEQLRELETLKKAREKLYSQIAAKKPFLLSGVEITDNVKNRHQSVCNKLITTSGADFMYSDRAESMMVLAKALEKRYLHWKRRESDRNVHPIPFLADGPGTGKSRFLQELPTSFVNHVLNGEYSQDLKSAFKDPVCINITFGNASTYTEREAQECHIENSICIRILYQFQSECTVFSKYYDSLSPSTLTCSLSATLEIISKNATCIILGIDEVNTLHCTLKTLGKEKQVSGFENDKLNELFRLFGSLSCIFRPFFVPVFAGTVIGPMKSAVRESTHPPLHIPLPLLSFESCLQIFENKDQRFSLLVQTNQNLRQLIADCGGHCRSLEILYSCFLDFYREDALAIDWLGINEKVRAVLRSRYDIAGTPLGTAIAKSFLLLDVDESNEYPEMEKTKYRDLEEKGLIKLVNCKITMPYLFVSVFMLESATTLYSKFWVELLIEKNFWWQDWQVFNRNYISFRLSLYAYLGISTVSLKEFFKGAKMNIQTDLQINIPPLDSLKLSKIDYRYPSTRAPLFQIGEHVLNGDEAPFDSFLYLETTSHPLLLAFQMNMGNQGSQRPQQLSNDNIAVEYKKINDEIAKNVPGTDFVCVILGMCESNVNETDLPSNCVVVSTNEHLDFYGPSFGHRLRNRA